MVRGGAGIGKTALLDHLVERTGGDCRVNRAGGTEAEMELPFAGLHQLCGSLLDSVDHLPGPQRDALGVAFGLSRGGSPNRFLLGPAVLSHLAVVAEARPLICLVDDANGSIGLRHRFSDLLRDALWRSRSASSSRCQSRRRGVRSKGFPS
ncbi:hypothetical protein M2283_000147 [Streptomyces pseudovenezuelae]|uniref:Orc1-like AAA ATPase domain-containing protein n=1 Tax=Streptomyces pseudovenezuelae TaxID=67350 RepID=A0ABT6L969_9ACTN|nr:hypothetical protein [Streptomyces pseudovenezuelae]